MFNNICAVILAAGAGTRMKSALPKVLHEVTGRPMVLFPIDLIRSLKIKDSVIVLGHKDNLVSEILGSDINTVKQNKLLGTADAVKAARKNITKDNVLILYADNPLLKRQTLLELIRKHASAKVSCTLLTAILDNPSGYGRIIRDKNNRVCAIVEDKDLSSSQKNIKEINSGVCCFKKDILFDLLDEVKPHNKKKEFYLTDVIELLVNSDHKVEAIQIKDSDEIMGINTRLDLAKANAIMRTRILNNFMLKGVTIVDPASTFIAKDVKIGKDTIIHPFSIIDEGVVIGKNCSIGPFCHLRPGAIIEDEAKIGNFVEVVRSRIGKNTLVKHFSYLGDAKIGKRVNIGAGTVTANYDGKNKNTTTIEDGAFIGSDTVLVAPVKIGRGATTGAGCVVTKRRNVPDKTVVAGVPAKALRDNNISLASKTK